MRARRDVVVAASLAALVAVAQPAGAQVPAAAAPGAVEGVVYDSLSRSALAGATVQVVRAADVNGGRSVTADASGAFRIDSLAPGRYFVGFFHPLLELLRVDATPRLVELGPDGEAVRVDLAVPDLPGVRAAVCGSAPAAEDSSGMVAGRVRDAADGAPVAGAKVVLTWSEVVLGAKGVQTERHRVPTTTGPGGGYVICGVPAGEELVITAEGSGRASGEVVVEMSPRGFVVRDLTLGDSPVAVAGRDSATARVARGTARVTGTVYDTTGRPIRGARAIVWGTSSSATTGGRGTFVLDGLPAGSHTLEVRAIGYAVRRVAVNLAHGRTDTLAIRMEGVRTLESVTVLGTPSRRSIFLDEFLDRQRHYAHGRYVTAADIERRNPGEVSDMLRGVAGLQVMPDSRFGNVVLGRGGPFGTCAARVLVDGMTLPAGEQIDRWVSPQAVAGIEVYTDGMLAPPQYFGRRADPAYGSDFCSVILVWTRK